MANIVGTLGTIPTLSVGSYTFTDFTTLKVLYGNMNNNNRTTLRTAGATSGYQVPVSKTFKLRSIWVEVGATNYDISPMYADNDLGINSATAPTNPVYLFGTASADTIRVPSAASFGHFVPIIWDIPTGKYPAMDGTTGGGGGGGGGASSRFIMFGSEV